MTSLSSAWAPCARAWGAGRPIVGRYCWGSSSARTLRVRPLWSWTRVAACRAGVRGCTPTLAVSSLPNVAAPSRGPCVMQDRWTPQRSRHTSQHR